MQKRILFLFLSVGLLLTDLAIAKDNTPPGRLPDEFESDGGHTLGFSYGGTAAVSGQGSIRANPAMLVFEKKYEVSAGYNWPSVGREFYQAGVVDSKTASFAAGFTYTSFRERFKNPNELSDKDEKYQAFYDSPIKNRLSIGLAQAFSKFSVGLGAQIVNSATDADSKRGVTLGGGLAGLLTPKLRFGLSAENLANRGIKNVAPTVFRGGLAYMLFDGDLTLHLDYRQRERVAVEGLSFETASNEKNKYSSSEKMAIVSSSVRIQDLLRLLAGYGMEVGGKRSSLSGGVALVNKNFSFSYLLGKPYMQHGNMHQAVNLEMQLAF